MTITELMVGDWVRVIPYKKNGRIYRIDYTYGKGNEYIGVIDGDFDIGLLEPIPLTPEILKRNEFERLSDYQWEYRDNSCKIVISVAPQIEIDGAIIGTPPINIMLEGASVTMSITSDCYVHDLQHIIRLCGIDKEIVI